MTTSRSIALVSLVWWGCGSPTDTALDASSALDARADAPADANLPRCEDVGLDPWDLARGTWSRELGPRGLSDDGPTRGEALDLAWHDGTLFVAGSFSHAGPIAASNVAAWAAGAGWRALGDGVPEPVGRIVVASDGTVYAASSTRGTPTATVHRYDGATWESIGTADRVADLAIDVDGSVLVGGSFASIAGVPTPDHFARWDGSAWTAIAQPGFDVGAIHVDAERLCIGGRDLGSTGYVACRAHGAETWEVLPIPTQPGPPYPDPVNAIARDASGRVIVGGGVYLGTSQQLGGVIRWTGTEWEMLEPGLGHPSSPMEVLSIAHAADGRLYAAGIFETIGRDSSPSAFALRIARWADERWQDIGGVQGGYPAAAVVVAGADTDVYVGGQMFEAFPRGTGGWRAVASIARFDGSSWHALVHPGAAAHGPRDVAAIAGRGKCAPYLAGAFQVVEDEPVTHVGRVGADGAMDPVATRSGIHEPSALAVAPDGTLFAAGRWMELFDASGGSSSTPLARLVRGEWESFGSLDPSANPRALAIDAGGALYVGGDFVESDPARSHLVRWDGTTWAAVGAREDPRPITALLAEDGRLYAAESLAEGGARVSRFDGSRWDALGAPVASDVTALVWHEGALVAAGRGLVDGAHIARFDGAAWESLGPIGTTTTQIRALASLGGALVAGGYDRTSEVRGILAHHTASGWEELGGSIDGVVSALAFTGDGLLVGGSFEYVAGVPSWGLALLAP